MEKKEVFAKVRFDIETKKANAYFHADEDWSNHPEYPTMIKLGNFYEATFEEYLLCNNAQQCVIDGVLQPFVEADDVKLERAKALKSSELSRIYASDDTWKFTIIYEPVQTPVLCPTKLQQNVIAKLGTVIEFYDINGNEKNITTTTTKSSAMINDNTKIALSLKRKNKEVLLKISNAKSVEEVEKIDIEKEFATVKKIITIS